MFQILIPLGAFLSSGVGYLAARVLMALGIGTLTYGSVLILLNQIFVQAQGYYNNVPVFTLQILNLAGFGDAMGIVMGAVLARAAFVFLPKLGVIPK